MEAVTKGRKPYNKRRYDTKEKYAELYAKGHTNPEIAVLLNLDYSYVCEICRKLGLIPHNPAKDFRDNHKLTKEQKELIIGTLLGDSYIGYVHDYSKGPLISFTHCEAQQEYFQHKVDCLQPVVNYTTTVVTNNGFSNGTIHYMGHSRSMSCLIEFHDAFYVGSTKILPIEYLENEFTERSIFYWFMDDGHRDKHTDTYGISTHCFNRDELVQFTELLKQKFGLNFTIKKDGSLYLKKQSNPILTGILRKYNTVKSMEYKISEK